MYFSLDDLGFARVDGTKGAPRTRNTRTGTHSMPRLFHVTTVPLSLRFLGGQVGFMKARGYDVHVVSSPGPLLDDFGRAEGVEAHAVPMSRRIDPGGDIVALARLIQLFRRHRPEIVHAHTPKGGLLGMMAATAARVPVRVYHMRGLPLVTATGAKRAVLAATERVSCGLASTTLSVSPSLRRRALDLGLASEDRIRVVLGGSGNGVDAQRRFRPSLERARGRAKRAELGIPESAEVIGFVGRLVREKGVVELASAWARLREARPDVHLVLVGPTEPEDPVPPEVLRALEADPRVHLLGFTEDTPALYEAFDLVALPTYREGFPNVLLEAAAMELPVVSTEVDGCVDAVVPGVTGELVPARDADALRRAIEGYLGDPERRRAHGVAARARVETRFEQQRLWEAIESLYRELASR
jgi:glycosyltransferase involved in cell wall biosynthesis